MKQRVACALIGLLFLGGTSSPGFAMSGFGMSSSLIGFWSTGANQAVTQIYGCGDNQLCGELAGFPMDHPSDPMPKTWDDRPQCHFVFIRYLSDDGDSWQGTIVNPQSGHSYGAEVQLVPPNQLKLRGFLLVPALGATRIWTRYAGPPPPDDCRMPAGSLN
jgi:uncharacterized protein (DUF2147 family)